MFVENIGAFLIPIFGFSFFKDSVSLKCYICGDENLNENDECRMQFLYDCTHYAKNFPSNEPIFCRTMRKASNGTYIITKECISEQDHYRKFPPRQYAFDEECDLIEFGGDEIAYCLCRKNFCNMKNIIDQIVEFEENYPEIFVATATDKNGVEQVATSVQKYSTQLINPIIRNAQQTETNINYGALNAALSNGLRRQMSIFPLKRNYQPTMFTDSVITNILFGQNQNSIEKNNATGKFAAFQEMMTSGNFCYYCLENLIDPTQDCLNPETVQCHISEITKRSHLCITKQSRIANDLYKLEKRCSNDLEENEITFHEILKEKITCLRTIDASQAFCLCLDHYCNKNSLLEQAESINGGDSLTDSKLNENANSGFSSTTIQSRTVTNNATQFTTALASPNFANKLNSWASIKTKNLKYSNGKTSKNLSMQFIIIIMLAFRFLFP